MSNSMRLIETASIDYSNIHKNLLNRVEFDNNEQDLINSSLQSKNIAKKSLLLKAGYPIKYFYYVNSGALRAYTLDKQGKEATVMFALSDWWITDMFCFLNERPAMMYIEALEDSIVFQISKQNLDDLLLKVPKFEKFLRLLMQNAYTREQLRIIERLTLTAEERYNTFIKKYPQIAKAITQKQIASYLGITPEFLSAIRKNGIKRIS